MITTTGTGLGIRGSSRHAEHDVIDRRMSSASAPDTEQGGAATRLSVRQAQRLSEDRLRSAARGSKALLSRDNRQAFARDVFEAVGGARGPG